MKECGNNHPYNIRGNVKPMKILEELEQWKAEYEQGWLAHYQATG